MKKEIISFDIKQSTKVISLVGAFAATPFSILGFFLFLAGLYSTNAELIVIGIMYIAMPLIYLIMGYVFMPFFLWIYNKVAQKVGGITYTVKDKQSHP